MHKHIYELVNAGLEHFIIIIYNKIQFHTFSLTHFWHTSGKILILEQNFELIKLWQLCLAPTHLLYMSQFFKKKKLGFEPKPTHLFGQCHEICSFFSDGFPNTFLIVWKTEVGIGSLPFTIDKKILKWVPSHLISFYSIIYNCIKHKLAS